MTGADEATPKPWQFGLVDVFAVEPLTGNPLAVVADADQLEVAMMRRIAREFNQSETTFVCQPTDDGADCWLRSFTPAGAEVTGAGHNALGAWWWLAVSGRLPLPAQGGRFVQQLGDRLLPVEVSAAAGVVGAITMAQTPPMPGQVHPQPARLAEALGLAADDIGLAGLPVQVVSTGAPHLLVPARDRGAVRRAQPKAGQLAAQLQAVGAQGCYLFCLDPVSDDAAAHARFFNPTVGISEDPATGSAAGPLASYLVANGVLADGSTVVIEQGEQVGRPSRIEVRVQGSQVLLRGSAVVVAEGTLWV